MAYKKREYIYNDKLSSEENHILDLAYKLKLSHMAVNLENQFNNPNSGLESFMSRLTEALDYEWNTRQDIKFNKLLKKATLKYPSADFDSSLYEPDRMMDTHTIELLAKCDWIDDHKNLLITGGAGAGKTFIANALCIAALRHLKTVKYIRANYFLQECEKAHNENTYYEYMNTMSEFDLLVIDDFGLNDLNMDKCRDIFEVLESRDSIKSTVIISQLPVVKWYDLFPDNTFADACLSRATSKAYRLDCQGRDMRKD